MEIETILKQAIRQKEQALGIRALLFFSSVHEKVPFEYPSHDHEALSSLYLCQAIGDETLTATSMLACLRRAVTLNPNASYTAGDQHLPLRTEVGMTTNRLAIHYIGIQLTVTEESALRMNRLLDYIRERNQQKSLYTPGKERQPNGRR